MKKIFSVILCLSIVLTLFSGCQAAPDSAVVAGKNDGTFESALQSSAEPAGNADTEPFSYSESFTSTDGKIEFNINIPEVDYTGNPMPVIQVTPEPITGEQAKRIAETLFGSDTKFYEYSEDKSKKELEEEILHYRLISSYEYIREEYRDSPQSPEEIEAAIQMHMEARQEILAKYEAMYAEASENVVQEECKWTFFPQSHYYPLIDPDPDADKTK